MQRDNERDLISAWQSGSFPAAQEFVRQRQAEVRTIAFLLTLERNRARGLAEAAFVRFFKSSRSIDADTDTRVELLARLGRLYLRNEYEPVEASSPDTFAGGPPQKYGVENQRDRTLAALGRLEERERVALVLGEVAGFSPEQLNMVLERGNTALVAPVETGRQRLRHSLDIPPGQPVRPALLDASFDGPREDLWAGIEDDIHQIHREEQRRGQLLTYGIVAGVILVALISIVALFGNDIFNLSDDEQSASANATATTTIDELILTPEPTVIPPTPTPTPEPLPLADVPGVMLASQYSRSTGAGPVVSPVQYDPEANELTLLDTDWDLTDTDNVVSSWITPDGARFLLVREVNGDAGPEYAVDALDSATLERQWQTPVGLFPDSPGTQFPVVPSVVSSSETLFVARTTESPSVLEIEAYDLEDGSSGGTVEIELDLDDETREEPYLPALYVTPDQSRLLLVAMEPGDINNNPPEPIHLVQLSLPDLERVADDSRPFTDDSGQFSTLGAKLTLDGTAFYRISYGAPGIPGQVEFLDIETGDRSAIMIPFLDHEDLPFRNVTTFHSHDGYRFYMIDAMAGDVAVIHLDERRLERYFSIDTSQFDTLFGTENGQLAFTWSAILSMDGERLYIGAGEHRLGNRSTNGGQTGIWVIDVGTWTVSDFWPVEGIIGSLINESADGSILARMWEGSEHLPGAAIRIARADDGSTIQQVASPQFDDDVEIALVTLSAHYKANYGRSPAVDGVAPVDLSEFSTLPRVEASTRTNVVSNRATTISVRIFDPVSGNILRAPRDDVRFDFGSTVSAYLTLDGEAPQLLVLSQAEPGVYQAEASLPAEGSWDINVSIIAPDSTTTTVPAAGSIEVVPTLTGSDGERYQFRVSFDPDRPVVGEEANFRIRLVNVESGAVVSEDVTFDVEQAVLEGGTIEELPERLSMSLANPATFFGTRSIIAGATTYGVWEGRITFQDAGTWDTAIRLQFAGLPLGQIPSSRVFVGERP